MDQVAPLQMPRIEIANWSSCPHMHHRWAEVPILHIRTSEAEF
jgi:hypothetical protein